METVRRRATRDATFVALLARDAGRPPHALLTASATPRARLALIVFWLSGEQLLHTKFFIAVQVKDIFYFDCLIL